VATRLGIEQKVELDNEGNKQTDHLQIKANGLLFLNTQDNKSFFRTKIISTWPRE
jgi:hypothetical protein